MQRFSTVKYDFFDDANDDFLKSRFAMLLIDSKNCKIEENEEVKKSYLIVKRDKRDDFIDFNNETIAVHDIDDFDVADDVDTKTNKKTNVKNVEKKVTAEKNEKDFFDFLLCFVRT